CELPAASALGIAGDRMALAFAAGRAVPRHFENSEQTRSCDYPPRFGPVPPCFARGTVVGGPGGDAWYLSGTAAIRGHETRGAGFTEQFGLTIENVRRMFATMGVPDAAAPRWKVFLRHRDRLEECRALFSQAFPGQEAQTSFLLADICRSCLLVE